MSTSKKTTAKATKSSTPATKEKSTTPAAPKAAAAKKPAKKAAVEKPAAPVAPVAVAVAPAAKPVAAPKAAAKPAAPVASAAPAVVAAPAPVAAAPAPVAPAPAPVPVAVKKVASKPVTTTIFAKIDIGFGNQLHIRGEGPGLSWDYGVAMENVGSDEWKIELGESARPFTFKFLVNDLSWSAGPDYTAEPGSTQTLLPTF